MKTKAVYILLWIFVLVLSSCDSGEKRLYLDQMVGISKKSIGKDQGRVKNEIFQDVNYLHQVDMDEINSDVFARIGNEKLVIDSISYYLFYLGFGKRELIGYWGESNDSLMFIPYHENTCETQFLITTWGGNGYFEINQDTCPDMTDSYIGDGYSFKSNSLDERIVSVFQFVTPKYLVNITESEYLKEAVILNTVVDKERGVLFLHYNFDLEKEPIIPWLKSTITEEDLS